MTVDHSLNFVDPVTGCHTNTVEGMWMHAKAQSKREGGYSATSVPKHQWNQRCLSTVVPEVCSCFKFPFTFIVFYFLLHTYIP